jgi:hypothetical protein
LFEDKKAREKEEQKRKALLADTTFDDATTWVLMVESPEQEANRN